MSTTTVGDLFVRADMLTRGLAASHANVTAHQWNSFDETLHQLLVTLAAATDLPALQRNDGQRRRWRQVLADYPEPLRPALGTTSYTIAEAAAVRHLPSAAITAQVRSGRMSAYREHTGLRIDADDLHRDTFTPLAESCDPHPLARLALTLGGLNDLLTYGTTPATPTLHHLDHAAAAGVAARVLSIAAVAARHALDHGPIGDAMRPLRVAQYADRAFDILAPSGPGFQIPAVSAATAPEQPATTAERLEAAVCMWSDVARTEMRQTVPSVEVLRNVLNQAAHAHAATARVLQHVQEPHAGTAESCAPSADAEASSDAHGILRDGLAALRHAEQALANRTTAMRPSHEYTAAARQLYLTLAETCAVSTDPRVNPAAIPLDSELILRTLAAVNEHSLTTLERHRHLPDALIRSHLLFAPARALRATPDRFPARTTGRLTTVDFADEPNLSTALLGAADSLNRAAVEVFQPLLRGSALPGPSPQL